MTFDWEEYLKLALYLISNGEDYSQEAGLRSATSRAYYAAFCYSRNFAQRSLGFIPDFDSRDHHSLRSHFAKRNLDNISRKLDRLRQWRNSCDYDNEINNLELLSKNSISEARYILKWLGK
jgi:uncharacterized protein (UPF0332 family)